MNSEIRSRAHTVLLRQGVSNTRVLIAVSGGVDSMSLLDVVESLQGELQLDIHVAHIDHALRDDSADDAEALAANIQKRGLPLHMARLDVPAAEAESDTGIEATARRLRYEYLTSTAETIGASTVMTGHTADDVIETVLMSVARAGSLHALAGIPTARSLSPTVRVVRPLIDCRRADVLAYARVRGIVWREDPSNSEARFLRNRVRHHLLPVMTSVFGAGIGRNIIRMARTMNELAVMIDERASEVRQKLLRVRDNAALLDLECLAGYPGVVTDTVLRRELNLGAVDRERVHSLLSAEVGTHATLSGGRLALRDREHIVVYSRQTEQSPAEEFVIAPDKERVTVPYCIGENVLSVRLVTGRGELGDVPAASAVIDLDGISGSLRCRPWRRGDRVRLMGTDGSKLVSDVLTDAKIPHAMRHQIHVVADDEGILWVCGIRQSNRARFTDDTVRYLVCWVKPKAEPQ